MVPLSKLVTVTPTTGPDVVYHYNRHRTAKLPGSAGPGFSSGQAADAIEEAAKKAMPPGFCDEWTGTVFQGGARVAGGGAAGFCAVVESALQWRAGQLFAGAGREAEPVPGRSGSGAAEAE
jgi:multidrug efflux pump subunit AcrB